jgi:glycogen debranching enzyme
LVPSVASLPYGLPSLNWNAPVFGSFGSYRRCRPEHAKSAVAATFENAIVLKSGNLFLFTAANGTLPLTEKHSFGLYYQDCRVLNGLEMRLSGQAPVFISATAPTGATAELAFTNPKIQGIDGRLIPGQELAIRCHRLLEGDPPAIHERLLFQNLARQDIEFNVSLSFRPSFDDILAVRGFPQNLGNLFDPIWEGGLLHVLYEGKDHLYRSLVIDFDPIPDFTDTTNAYFDIKLKPQATRELRTSQFVTFSPHRQNSLITVNKPEDFTEAATKLARTTETWMASITRVMSDSAALDKVLTRALLDLCLLQTKIDDLTFYAAGTPWFVTLFGRDSVIAALQTLAFDPSMAEQTLRLLAKIPRPPL